MARGKYAAKANGQRAEIAATTASALQSQLDQIQRDRVAEVAALKARIGSLEGQLLREVRELAASEVQRVRAEAAATLETERIRRREIGLKVSGFLDKEGVILPRHRWADLYAILGIQFGEAVDGNRNTRRSSNKRLRHIAALADRGMTAGQIEAGPPGR